MNKLILLLGLLSLFSCEYKRQNIFKLTDFNLSYTAPSGSADFSLYIGPKLQKSKMNATFEIKDELLYTSLPGITYAGEIPSLLKGSETINIDGFNILLEQNSATVSLEEYSLFDGESQKLLDATIDCLGSGSDAEEEILESILDACFHSGNLKLYSFENGDDFEISNSKASIRNGQLYYEGRIHTSIISGKLKVQGKAEFNKSTKVLSFKASKVKLGIISVKGRFFKELKKMESDSFKVNEPYIYYQF